MIYPSAISGGLPYKTWHPRGDHWANAGCQAWWIALPGQAFGHTFYDAFGVYPWTLNVSSTGTMQTLKWCWSPSELTAAGQTNGFILYINAMRPGALTQAAVGPFYYTPTGGYGWAAYGTSNFSLNTACPTGGTLSFWMCPQVTASNASLTESFWQGNASTWFQVGVYSGKFYFGYYTGTDYRVNYVIGSEWAQGSWSHYVITWVPGGLTKVYVNGLLYANSSANNPATLPTLSGNLYFGSTSSGFGSIEYFSPCAYDDVNIWNYTMSPTQVYDVYQQSGIGWPGRFDERTISFKPGVPIAVWFPPRVTPFVFHNCEFEE